MLDPVKSRKIIKHYTGQVASHFTGPPQKAAGQAG